jgi:hypothetical protein
MSYYYYVIGGGTSVPMMSGCASNSVPKTNSEFLRSSSVTVSAREYSGGSIVEISYMLAFGTVTKIVVVFLSKFKCRPRLR